MESGTGLGLSIAEKFLSAMGGKISFTRHPGEGTEFIVVLKKAGGDHTL